MLKKFSNPQKILIMIFLLFIPVFGIISINQYSLTSDETCYLGVGKSIIETGNFKVNVPVYHPPFSYYIGSLFLYPLNIDKEILQSYSCWEIGKNAAFYSGYNPDRIIFFSRLPFVLLSLILGIYVLIWATELFGPKSGVIALFLYSFNPSIIAYSSIHTPDFTVAGMFFIASYYFWKLIREPSRFNLISSGIFLGLALSSKISAILLIPIMAIIGFAAVYSNKYGLKLKILIRNLIYIFAIAYLVIFLLFGLQFGTLSDSLAPGHFSQKTRQELGNTGALSDKLLYIYDNVPIPTPSYWAELGGLFYLSAQESSGYAFGEITKNVPWYYVYLTFLLKTGIPILIFLVILLVKRKDFKKIDIVTKLSLLLPLAFMFLNFSLTNKMSGVRHILTIYPFISLLASNAINAYAKNRRLYKIFIFILLAYYGLTAFLISPDFISYINELGGGPNNAYKIMVGSNIDQGHDLKELKKFMDKNNIKNIKLSYFGNADPRNYNITFEYLPSPSFLYWVPDYTLLKIKEREEDCSAKTGLIAISITNLKNVHLINKTCFKWLENYEPVKKIGYTIFIYNINRGGS